MIRNFLILFVLVLLLLLLFYDKAVFSIELEPKTLEKYIYKISNKFSRTYCNTIRFGISNDGALAFAVGETNKEFKNKNLNKIIDYDILKKTILNNLEKNCQVNYLANDELDKLELN